MKVKDIVNIRDEMIKIAVYCGAKQYDVEDIVQDCFLRLCEIQQKEGSIDRLTYKGSINMVYIFNMVRNHTYDKYKRDKKMMVNSDFVKSLVTFQSSSPEYSIVLDEIEKTLGEGKDGRFYHSLYKAYFNDKISMRKLSKETNIGLRTIFEGVKYIKNKISEVI